MDEHIKAMVAVQWEKAKGELRSIIGIYKSNGTYIEDMEFELEKFIVNFEDNIYPERK
jgi:hypothetical protein